MYKESIVSYLEILGFDDMIRMEINKITQRKKWEVSDKGDVCLLRCMITFFSGKIFMISVLRKVTKRSI